ncbi:MAG: transposase [Spirochaetales bacterium]|nr:transposase [Spirochaetales bacterium]
MPGAAPAAAPARNPRGPCTPRFCLRQNRGVCHQARSEAECTSLSPPAAATTLPSHGHACSLRTRPREKDLYDIFCAILYLIKSGCQWRMLPADFPKWGIVRYYYDVWARKRAQGSTLFEEVLKKIGYTGEKW